MKNQVIKFLGDLPKSGSEQFNQALEHFRKSKNHDPEKIRYYNALGFSQDRLESLLYELKKLHSITDTEVAQAKKSPITPKGKNKKAPVVKKKTPVVKKTKKIAEKKEEASSEDISTALNGTKEESPLAPEGGIDDAQDISTALDGTKDVIAGDKKAETKDEAVIDQDVAIDAATEEREKFLKEDLADFDLETEKYNSIKSFAATLSDYINRDPADQKSDTLKAFVAEAKKKFAQA
jgi:hypothetical protein